MRAGTIDRIVTVQRRTITESNSGEPVETWADLVERWASIKPLTGTERLAGENLVAKEQVEFRLRWETAIADLSPDDRIVYPRSTDSPPSAPTDKDIYNIVQASEVGRREAMLVLAYRYVS